MKAVQKKQKKQKKRLRTAIPLLALVALLLAAARWGVPYAMSLFAQDKLDRGLAADAKELYVLIDRYWPEEFGAKAGMDAAEQKIIDGLMNVGTDAAYEQAALRAAAIGDTAREEKAVIAVPNWPPPTAIPARRRRFWPRLRTMRKRRAHCAG